MKPDPDHGGPLVRGVCPKLRRRDTKTELMLLLTTTGGTPRRPCPTFCDFFFPLSRFACVQRVTYFGAVHPDSPLFGRFFFVFFFHFTAPIFQTPAALPCPAGSRVLGSSCAPRLPPYCLSRRKKLSGAEDAGTHSSLPIPQKSSASRLPLSSTAAHKIRALPVCNFQSKTP